MKIVIAGGTGFLGRPLARALAADGHDVVVFTRGPVQPAAAGAPRTVTWDGRDPHGPWARELQEAGAVVNLSGANIGEKRWSEARKRALLQSRVEPTGALIAAIERLDPSTRPPVLVNASGIDYYGDRGDEVVTEESPPGESFLARLCVEWEAAARRAEALGVRVVLMRTAVVLDRNATALQRLVMPFRFFVGGPLGSGRQWFPWIHLVDTIGLYRLAIDSPQAAGPINVVAPDARREAEVAREVGRVLNRPSWVPAPAFALRLILGEQADLVLHGRRAEPRRAQALGYTFTYPRLPEALKEALS